MKNQIYFHKYNFQFWLNYFHQIDRKQNAADNADEITAEEERAEQAKLEEAKQREDEEQAALQQTEK